jgi:hypothetical protein
MALITCPECGAQVSDAAPACPKCGYPVAAAPAGAVAAATAATATTTPNPQPEPLATERSAEPFRLGGRRIPMAAVLFWGGMVVGVLQKYAIFGGNDVPAPFKYIPFVMIFGGMLWFSVTELTLLVRHRKRRR